MSLKADLNGVRDTYRLCFVRAPWAFLTRLTLDQQWGENWQHSPYQQFAGTPSHHLPDQLLTVAFDGPLYTPDTGSDIGLHSVLEINAGLVPWLRSESYAGGPPLHIMAGATLESFVTSVELAAVRYMFRWAGASSPAFRPLLRKSRFLPERVLDTLTNISLQPSPRALPRAGVRMPRRPMTTK